MATINGIEMHYEVRGKGEPLLLLHGWTQSSRFWEDYIPEFAKHFQVYALDLRGHGKTSALTPEFTIEKSSEDILALLEYLNLESVKAIGLSFGGLTLLELAKSNPEKIASMILIGASHNYNGADNNMDDSFSYENLPDAFKEELKLNHQNDEVKIKALSDPNLNYQINLGKEALEDIHAKTLIINGDRDEILGIDPAVTLHESLPNSELWIVPGTGHIAIVELNKNSFITKSIQFLKQ